MPDDWKALAPHSDDARLKKAVRWLLETHHVGRANAISHEALTAHFAAHGFSALEGDRTHRAVRLAIESLRNDDDVLICAASGAGVYIAETYEEVLEFINREMRPRARSLLTTARNLRRAGIRKFGGQARLF